LKDIVFVKFNAFIEELWGEEFWDEQLNEAELPGEGEYNSVSIYDDQKLFTIIGLMVDKKYHENIPCLPRENWCLKSYII
jgi:hypothetical protein